MYSRVPDIDRGSHPGHGLCGVNVFLIEWLDSDLIEVDQ
jgi:hypothetical protein